MKHDYTNDYTMDDFRAEMRRRNALEKERNRPPQLLKKRLQEFTSTTTSTTTHHTPRLTQDRSRIVGCTCGWRTPPGTTNSDDAFVAHATVMR